MSAPERYELTREALERDCDVTLLKGSGPGGQNRNKRETGVRLTHRPSGEVVMATERRSQSQNLEMAFQRMADRLAARMHVDPPRFATRPTRASRVRRLESKRRRSETKSLRRDLSD